MKQLIQKHCILFSGIILVLGLLGALSINGRIGRFVVAGLSIILVNVLGIRQTYFSERSRILQTIGRGLPIILLSAFSSLFSVFEAGAVTWDKMPSIKEATCFLISMLGVGLFEEALMRGTLFNIMRESWKDQREGMIKAAIISSIMFGMPHILNFFENPQLKWQTAAQMLYATFVGIYFCGLYVKNKNFIGLVIIHALVDAIAEGIALFSTDMERLLQTDTSLLEAAIEVIICLPFLYWGIKNLKSCSKSIRESE